ncbi:MAG: carboxypeptidase regulatory-like domain-containing protein [Hamadaea sp.]|uniref:carboxypeptidase-like regulatory domain-containing protein n=1 Tax=Hamadaea sp. TaxID=2024425 RepID=UPI00178F07D4|nr:carboxypeptidase-like regulatory domain-containing protein [Hamadaea sp.]NUR70063.1 carboxypeptidase regulatory-like domain-containing protein [Hamadaea sp.]NUT21607.1 carboxypeptidase regulatory-like domain-containing protein [Hamadaea sp.]
MTDPGPGPIEAASARLLDWLGRTAGTAAHLSTAEQKSGGKPDSGVTVYPLEVRPARQTRGTGPREPYRFTVRFLVTGPLPALDRLLIAAVRAGEPEILLTAGDPALWQALGIPPRPALIVDLPAAVTFPELPAPPVLHPLKIEHIGRRTLAGTVVGPGDVPLAAVRVEVLGTTLTATTDAHGRFTVAGVPDTGEVRLRLAGRGRTFVAAVEPGGDIGGGPDGPDLILRCDLPTR